MNSLERFIKGDMDQSEMEQFTKEMIHQQLDAETRQRWEDALKTQYGISRESNYPSLQSRKWKRLLVPAASLVLLVSAYLFIRKPSSIGYEQLADQYIESLPIMPDQLVFRKGAEEVAELRSDAYTFYSRAEYQKAIEAWQQLEAIDSLSTYDQFYRGTSCLRQIPANTSCTIERLISVRDQVPELSQEIDWVLSLAYLKTNELALAKPLLERIVDNSQFMDEAAQKLLDEISN